MTRHCWTDAEKDYVIKHYANTTSEKIARELGLALHQVYSVAKRLGLKKSTAFFASEESGRTRGDRGINTRFHAGQKSWNAGISYVPGGRSPETRFKPGNKPLNWMPVGSHRVNGGATLSAR